MFAALVEPLKNRNYVGGAGFAIKQRPYETHVCDVGLAIQNRHYVCGVGFAINKTINVDYVCGAGLAVKKSKLCLRR